MSKNGPKKRPKRAEKLNNKQKQRAFALYYYPISKATAYALSDVSDVSVGWATIYFCPSADRFLQGQGAFLYFYHHVSCLH